MVDAAGTSRRSTGTDSRGHMAMLEIGTSKQRLFDDYLSESLTRATPGLRPGIRRRGPAWVAMRVAWLSQVRPRSLLRRAV